MNIKLLEPFLVMGSVFIVMNIENRIVVGIDVDTDKSGASVYKIGTN